MEENKNEIFSLRYDKSNDSSESNSEDNGSDGIDVKDSSENNELAEFQDNKIKPFDNDQLDDYDDILPSIQSGSSDAKEKKKDHFEPRILGASQFEDSKLDNEIEELEAELQDNIDSQKAEHKVIQINTINSKRAATTGIPIRNFAKVQQIQINVYKPVTPRREGLETARSARRMVNKDTQRGIMGNVWISDLHNKEREEQNQDKYAKQTSLGLQGKKNTKYDDEFNLDELDKVLDNSDSPETKPVNSNKKSDKSSIFSMNDKQYDNYTFSSLDLSPGKKERKPKQLFDLEISDDFTDLKHDLS